MRHLKPFKLFEEAVPKPLKKFPTEPAVHWNYLIKVLEDSGRKDSRYMLIISKK